MLEASLSQLRETVDREMYSTYEAVFRALDALLRATCPPEPQTSGSSKSLLAMCLRRIPDYIAELEYWEKTDAEANKTKSVIQEPKASFYIYSELESLGALGGWKHLRTVVRAHGVQIIQGAIRDGLVEDRVATTLIGLCCMYLPFVESMGLIDVFISRQYSPPDPSVRDGLTVKAPALFPLWAFGLGNGTTKRFMLGKLADLFGDGSLPAEWLLVDAFKNTRLDAMAKMFYGAGQDCVDFMITMINVLSPLMSAWRKKKTLASASCSSTDKNPHQEAAAVLTGGMATLVSEVLSYLDDPDRERPTLTPAQRAVFVHRVRYIFRAYLLHARKTTGLPTPAVYLISLCDFLAFRTESSAATIASAAWKEVKSGQRIDRRDEQYLTTLGVLSTIVSNYSRENGSTSAHTYIPQICDKLKVLQIPDKLPYHPFENIDIDVAFAVAFQTNDLQDLAYAEKLWAKKNSVTCSYTWMKPTPYYEERIRARGESEGKPFSGFKWDDALSEWVTLDSPEPPVGVGGGRMTRRSTRCPPKTDALQQYPSPTTATPAAVASASTSTSGTNRRPTRGTRLLRSSSASTTTTPATDDNTVDDDDDLENDEEDDNSSETSTTTSQTDADVASDSEWDSDFETSNVVGLNKTHHQQIPTPRTQPPPPRTQTQPQPQRRRLSGNKRKLRPLDTEDEDEDGQEGDSNEDDDNDNLIRCPVAKRPRTRASLAAATATSGASSTASGIATASGSGTSGGGRTARRSLGRYAGSSGSGRAVHEDTSEDELG